MKEFKMNSKGLLTVCIAGVGLLTLVDLGIRAYQQRAIAFSKQFSVVPLHTNGTTGILIGDRSKNQPLLGKWHFEAGESVDFFVEGRSVLTVASAKNGHSETEVRFYDKDGRLISEWKARENGVFYMRTLFAEAGARSEVWLNESWHTIEMRTNRGKAEAGTVLDGKWRRLITTNGIPGVE